MGQLDRRQFIAGTSAAAADFAFSGQSEAGEKPVKFTESSLMPADIEKHKSLAARSLRSSIPKSNKLEHVRAFARHLEQESQMAIPSRTEINIVTKRAAAPLLGLAANMEIGDYGLFAFSDVISGKLTQKLYVLSKSSSSEIEFVKSYLISMSNEGFGNEQDSNKTPSGLHEIQSGESGNLGKVVSTKINPSLFIEVDGSFYIKGFGTGHENNAVAVITDRLTIDGERGIHVHGVNLSGDILPDGSWKTLLDGTRRSSGCLRMANADVRDLLLSGYAKWRQEKRGKKRATKGTSIQIFATPEAIAYIAAHKHEGAGRKPPHPLWLELDKGKKK